MKRCGACLSVAFVLMALLAGCLYSVEVYPPVSFDSTVQLVPLPGTLGLGSINTSIMGTQSNLGLYERTVVEDTFIAAATNEELFTAVVGSASPADMYIDVIVYPLVDHSVSLKASLYQELMTLTGVGLVTPVPYPLYIDAKAAFIFYTEQDGVRETIKQYDATFKTKVWTASLIGARWKRYKVMQAITEYVTPIVFSYLKNDYNVYAKIFDDLVRSELNVKIVT